MYIVIYYIVYIVIAIYIFNGQQLLNSYSKTLRRKNRYIYNINNIIYNTNYYTIDQV